MHHAGFTAGDHSSCLHVCHDLSCIVLVSQPVLSLLCVCMMLTYFCCAPCWFHSWCSRSILCTNGGGAQRTSAHCTVTGLVVATACASQCGCFCNSLFGSWLAAMPVSVDAASITCVICCDDECGGCGEVHGTFLSFIVVSKRPGVGRGTYKPADRSEHEWNDFCFRADTTAVWSSIPYWLLCCLGAVLRSC